MKKMNSISLALLAIAGTAQGSSTPTITAQSNATQKRMASGTTPSDFAKTVADVLQSRTSQPLTIPSDVIEKLQRVTAIQREKANMKPIVLASGELEEGNSDSRNLTTVMPSNRNFMNKFTTYTVYSGQLAHDHAALAASMKTMTAAQKDQMKAKFDDILTKQVYLTTMLEDLKSEFLKEQPLFAKLHKEEQELLMALLQIIGSFMEKLTGQPLSETKKTQLIEAAKLASRPEEATTSEERR